jgi:hypothetical protein
MERGIFFNLIYTPLKIEAPIGLRIVFVNKKIMGNEHTSVKLHYIEGPTSCQHLKVPTFKYVTCH